ncbi:hypothetical protein H6F74_16910 [Trichocoleus sp. FACHB-90]|uniref:hypothetical protein n=1 Tax=Cyanophyceae TaxID=3028117 RepID=UPI001688403A|nr:hypothetical protein [Trichocoleus sp. FACHB-90]MBD1927911.1 hypothetical protein [Trichocoleus sp. FACHB-90]
MTIIRNYFDYLHFTECEFEKVEFDKKLFPPKNDSDLDFDDIVLFYKRAIGSVKKEEHLPIIMCSKIVILTHKIGILPGHTLNTTDDVIFLPECNLIFEGVKRWVRHETRYVEELSGSNRFQPKETRQETVPDDLFSIFAPPPVTLFEIEGIFKNPLRWVDWEIESISFGLEVLTPQDTLSENYSKSVSGEMGKY